MAFCALSYVSLAADLHDLLAHIASTGKGTNLMIVFPNHLPVIMPSTVMVNTAEKASRSACCVKLQSSSERVGGSIGTARCTRYTVVARLRASLSREVLGLTK